MSKIIIGIDPDSKAHGVAIYKNGKLTDLSNSTIVDMMEFLDAVSRLETVNFEVHIEDVCANNAVFMSPSKNTNKIAEAKARGRTLGMCQQSQTELERVFDYYGIEVIKHKISKQWKSAKVGRPVFERITGWTKQSNEDTRSAAYFGWLGVTK